MIEWFGKSIIGELRKITGNLQNLVHFAHVQQKIGKKYLRYCLAIQKYFFSTNVVTIVQKAIFKQVPNFFSIILI